MLGLNWLVKRAHKSIPGLWLQENDTTLTGVCCACGMCGYNEALGNCSW
jgi:hypothetical protein